ncbi:tetratricopeptide repeat protein [Candidatus Omnitrophota bacterium]
MKRFLVCVIVIGLAAGLTLNGCGPKKVGTSQEAIKVSQTMGSAEKKTNYLMAQAQAFFKSKDFQEAINLSQYVLWNLDSDSTEAKKMIRTAQDAMAVQAQMAKQKAQG